MRYLSPRVPYENRLCPMCQQEAENEVHLLFKCTAACYTDTRKNFLDKLNELVPNFKDLSTDDQAFYLMSQENESVTNCTAEYIDQMQTERQKYLRHAEGQGKNNVISHFPL